jgi:hypothetical protein
MFTEIALPGMVMDERIIFLGNLDCPIRRTRVHHNKLIHATSDAI